MKKFLFLCFVASGILFSDANGANLKRSKFIDFNTGKSTLNDDTTLIEGSPIIDNSSDSIWFFSPQIKVHSPKAVKSYRCHLAESEEEDDEFAFDISDNTSEMYETSANTQYNEVVQIGDCSIRRCKSRNLSVPTISNK